MAMRPLSKNNMTPSTMKKRPKLVSMMPIFRLSVSVNMLALRFACVSWHAHERRASTGGLQWMLHKFTVR